MLEKAIMGDALKPAISVVLATKGTKVVFLQKCLRSLQKQRFKEFEIVLVYSVFPNSLRELLEACNTTSLREDSSTLGAARNLGVKHAKGELVAFIDDDCEAQEDWLEKIYSAFQRDPLLSCLGGPHLTPNEECRESPLKFAEGSFHESRMQRILLNRSTVGKISGCNVAYRKEVFDRIGYLDTILRSGEDWEFNVRLAEKGCQMRFDPEIVVWHHRQGLKHAFLGCSNVVPFFLSWKTLKYSKYESVFATFYLTTILAPLLLMITLFTSPLIFLLLLSSLLLTYFIFTALRTKTHNWRIVYYLLIVPMTLSRWMGFYFGLFKYIMSKLRLRLQR